MKRWPSCSGAGQRTTAGGRPQDCLKLPVPRGANRAEGVSGPGFNLRASASSGRAPEESPSAEEDLRLFPSRQVSGAIELGVAGLDSPDVEVCSLATDDRSQYKPTPDCVQGPRNPRGPVCLFPPVAPRPGSVIRTGWERPSWTCTQDTPWASSSVNSCFAHIADVSQAAPSLAHRDGDRGTRQN
jgi:hypothetical protein